MVILLMGERFRQDYSRKTAFPGTRLKYYEGDDFHPSANVEKLRSGILLDDADRRPWLETLRALLRYCLEQGESAVLNLLRTEAELSGVSPDRFKGSF